MMVPCICAWPRSARFRWRTWPWPKANVGAGPSSLAYRLGVSMADAAIGGHFKGKSVKGARIHRFLLNKESARLSPTWRVNCRCFVDQRVNLYVCRTTLGR
jgi:hypothetical protein